MTIAFADTQYWVALINDRDQWAPAARALTASRQFELVTTDEVLVETLNFVSGLGSSIRLAAVELARHLLLDESVRLIPQSRTTFLNALDFYESRQDKGYSLVDCVSMVAMRNLGITDVLTADHHFAQEGFTPLLAR